MARTSEISDELWVEDENRRLKIAFLTSLDPKDRRSWSGTIFYVAQALQKYCGEVTYIGPITAKEKTIGKVINKLSLFFLKKRFAFNHSFWLARKYAQVAERRLAGQSFDVIVTVTGATDIAFLKTDIPIVLIEDATFVLLHNYYPQYTNLLNVSIRETNGTEALAIKKASLALYPSTWAARSAIDFYDADEGKVHVVPYGANFEVPPPRTLVLQREKSDRCRLLFVGVDWERKGGEIAFETLLKLEEMGIAAELIICGCVPPEKFSHPRMKVIPFLNKNDEKQRKEFEELYLTSDFLLVPTRSECYGLVFCEANAFGLPCIATDTGGVSEIIREGENGFMLPLSARGADYAEVIANVYLDEQRYTALVQSSRAAFEDRLNWDMWGTTVKHLLTQLIHRKNEEDRQEVATENARL